MHAHTPHAHNRQKVGDEVVTADDLAQGDIVYFERIAPNRVVVRAMTGDVLPRYDGPLFVLAGMDGKGVAQFLEVSREDIE